MIYFETTLDFVNRNIISNTENILQSSESRYGVEHKQKRLEQIKRDSVVLEHEDLTFKSDIFLLTKQKHENKFSD